MAALLVFYACNRYNMVYSKRRTRDFFPKEVVKEMVRIVRRFLTTLFPQMPATLDFRMFSERDIIGYVPVLPSPNDPVPVGAGLSVRHFFIMEDADACSCYLTSSYALTLALDENDTVDVKVVNVDRDAAEYDETMSVDDWVGKMPQLVSSYQN